MFPTLSEYNKTIQIHGANAFRNLRNLFFIPARTTPIKIYSFGSGSFAVVFKALENNKEFAIRCFIGTDIDYVERYRKIDSYLKTIKEDWKTDIEFLENEIEINGKLFPIVKMDWAEGKLLDKYLNNNLQNNVILYELQKQILKTSRNLEKNKIAHGDIQCGNIIVKEVTGKPQVKLIDYDGMYIPDFQGKKQIERGRSEFQHPKRDNFEFNEEIDRFSFWVILCALEALKFDKTLWNEVMQGGFNTLDNLLFVANDFNNPSQSKLFNRLEKLNQPSLNFYLDKLKFALYNSKIDEIQLFEDNQSFEPNIQKTESFPDYKTQNQFARLKITSLPSGASVRNNQYESIGITPLTLNKYDYLNQEIKIILGTKSKSIVVYELGNDIYIDFEQIKVNKPKIKKREPDSSFTTVQKPNVESNPIIWIGLLLIILLVCFSIFQITKNNNIDYSAEEVAVDTTAMDVDDFTASVDSSANFIDSTTIPKKANVQAVDNLSSNDNEVPTNITTEEFIENLNKFNGGYIIDRIDEFKNDKNSSKWVLDNTLNYGELYINNLNLSFKKTSMENWKYVRMEFQEFDIKNDCYVLKDNYNQLIVIDANFKKITFLCNLNDNNNYENAYVYFILSKSNLVKPN